MDFFAELKRRQLFRVAAVYAVVAWLLLQVVNNLTPGLNLPNWVATSVIVVLALGFPVALIFAWIHQLAPADGATVRAKASGLDWVLVGGLGIVILLIGYQQIAPSRQAGVDAAKEASLDPRSGVSLAVLPFANLSDDETQAFFSDGITEEIITTLARIPDLRVVARESASQFKGERRDLRAVGQALGATHLIEGSVRKAGTRVRIAARLVKSDDGVNAWANSYDRELTDVFAIQEDIATAIAGALKMSLGLNPGEQLVANRAIDAASYEQFLRGKAEVQQKGRGAFAQQIAILEPVVARNPSYAPAWALLARGYRNAAQQYENIASQSTSPTEFERLRDSYFAKQDDAARRAIALDPNSVGALTMQATIEAGRHKWALAEDLISKALTLDPNDPETLDAYSTGLLILGRPKEAVAMKRRLRELEPFVPLYAGNLAEALWLDGQSDAAIALAKESMERSGGSGFRLTQIYASIGRYQEAADTLSRFQPPTEREIAPVAAGLLRSAPSNVAAPDSLPPLGRLGFVYVYVGAPERMLEYYEQARAPGDALAFLWHPSYAAVHKMERFKKIIRDAGLVDYWRERGWPAFCKPVGADDFECS